MSTFVEELLVNVAGDLPCGKDLEYDPEFGELERAAQPKPEQQFGNTVVDAEEPKWKDVQKIALKLFTRTKDLRAATYLTRALVHNEGYIGLTNGLTVICKLLELNWDCVHPQLDADDNNDPTFRVNSLLPLSDSANMVASVRETALVSSRSLGRYSLRDIAIAEGTLTATGDDKPTDMTTIDAAFMDCDLDELVQTNDSVVQSIANTETIESIMVDHVGTENAPDLTNLRNELKQARNILAERLSRRGVGVKTSDDAGIDAMTSEATAKPFTGEIKSRDDVVRMLDKACEYFKRNEPSSPVPLLLQRAKRLVSADFMEVVRELAPDGLTQAQRNAGVEVD